jgi:hypothetical protein
MPILQEMFPAYSDFGGKTMEDIFGRERLDQADKLKAELFETCLFRNNGSGRFQIEVLPVEAQFSPVRDMQVRDFNGDSLPDLVLLGNNYSVRPSYGSQDASYGWFLEADRSNFFSVRWPRESGLWIRGDARRIVPIVVAGDLHLVAGINNDSLRVIRHRNLTVSK